MNKQELLLDVITYVKKYLKEKDDGSFQDFISEHKDIFTLNIDNIDDINEEEISILYKITVYNKELSNDEILSAYIFTGKKFEQVICRSTTTYLYRQDTELRDNIFRMIYENIDFTAVVKHIYVLRNVKNSVMNNITNSIKKDYSLTNLGSFFPESKIVMEPEIEYYDIDFNTLISYIYENYQNLRFSKNFNILNGLTRFIGIRLSKNKLNVPYTVEFNLDDKIIPIRMNDYLDIKYVKYDNVIYRNSFKVKDSKSFREWANILIQKLKNPIIYSSLFLSQEDLSDFFPKLVFFKEYEKTTKEYPESKALFKTKILTFQKTICIHEIEFEKILSTSSNHYDDFIFFREKYIEFYKGQGTCKFCFKVIREFCQEDDNVIADMSSINKDIFNKAPFSDFIPSRYIIFTTITSFDVILQTTVTSHKNSITRLILEFLFFINSNQDNLEKKYVSDISKGVFFVRLSPSIFELGFSESELYYKEKNFNLNFIILFIIVLHISPNDIMNYINKNKISTISSEDDFIFILAKIIRYFFNRTNFEKISTTDQYSYFVKFYLKLAIPEIKGLYNIKLNQFYKMITSKKTLSIVDTDVENMLEFDDYNTRIFESKKLYAKILDYEEIKEETTVLDPLEIIKLISDEEVKEAKSLATFVCKYQGIVISNIINEESYYKLITPRRNIIIMKDSEELENDKLEIESSIFFKVFYKNKIELYFDNNSNKISEYYFIFLKHFFPNVKLDLKLKLDIKIFLSYIEELSYTKYKIWIENNTSKINSFLTLNEFIF